MATTFSNSELGLKRLDTLEFFNFIPFRFRSALSICNAHNKQSQSITSCYSSNLETSTNVLKTLRVRGLNLSRKEQAPDQNIPPGVPH